MSLGISYDLVDRLRLDSRSVSIVLFNYLILSRKGWTLMRINNVEVRAYKTGCIDHDALGIFSDKISYLSQQQERHQTCPASFHLSIFAWPPLPPELLDLYERSKRLSYVQEKRTDRVVFQLQPEA